jgi:putative membrane protein
MDKEKPEIIKNEETLEKYNVKSWFKSGLMGFLIGIAVIVPGISGATIAMIFNLYKKMLYALGNLLKKFVYCLVFLLPIAIGLIIGFVCGFFGVQALLNIAPFAVTCLFAGLMIGSEPVVFKQKKTKNMTPLQGILLILGILIPVALSLIAIFVSAENNLFEGFHWYAYVVMIPLGMVISLTQIVPGLSATSTLMSLGLFKHLIDAVSFSNITANPQWIGIFGCLGLGFIVGLLLFSKIVSSLIQKHNDTVFSLIIGLSLGSIITMFFNPEILHSVYIPWKEGTSLTGAISMVYDLPLGIAGLIVGFLVSFFLMRKQTKIDKTKIVSSND